MKDFSGSLKRINARLKAGKVGVAILQRYDRLYLRATFPPKPESHRTKPYQQELALGYRANGEGLRLAEQEAKLVGVALQRGDFDWTTYQARRGDVPESCGDWIERHREHYLEQGGTLSTWSGDYQKIFKKLDQDAPLDEAEILRVVLATSPNTKTRKRACMALGALAAVAGVEVDLSSYAGNYSPRRVAPRDLPDDETIAAVRDSIKSTAWRWAYGMLAAYGLRNHELFRLDFDRLAAGDRVVAVLDATKTGARECWPIYPEWFEEWELATVTLPGVNLERGNQALGHAVTEWFSANRMPFPAYSLRHCWAVRSMLFGLPTELASRMMGHSVQVHTDVYHHWLTRDHQQRVWTALMERPDRPRPPRHRKKGESKTLLPED